jgi:hypothetical protein
MFVTSCGYQLRRDESATTSLPRVGDRAATVFVPVVDNLTPRTGIESDLTTALRETLARLPGVEVIQSESNADYLLLARVTQFERSPGPTPVAGTGTTQAGGGLLSGLSTAADIRVKLGAEIRLVHQETAQSPRRVLWTRSYASDQLLSASRRQYSDIDDTLGASSSAYYINESRERFSYRGLTQSLANQIVDQVAQGF